MIFETLSFVDLPGTAPIVLASDEIDFPEHGVHVHNEGCDDEWSLECTKVDIEPAIDQ